MLLLNSWNDWWGQILFPPINWGLTFGKSPKLEAVDPQKQPKIAKRQLEEETISRKRISNVKDTQILQIVSKNDLWFFGTRVKFAFIRLRAWQYSRHAAHLERRVNNNYTSLSSVVNHISPISSNQCHMSTCLAVMPLGTFACTTQRGLQLTVSIICMSTQQETAVTHTF